MLVAPEAPGADCTAAAARMVLRCAAQARHEAPGFACRDLVAHLAGLGGAVGAGHPTGVGPRRDRVGGAVCGVGGQRSLSRLCHSRGLGRVAREHHTCLAARRVAAAAPAAGHAPPLAGHRLGRSGLVGAVAVAAPRQAGLAPVWAHQQRGNFASCWPHAAWRLLHLVPHLVRAAAPLVGPGPFWSCVAHRGGAGVPYARGIAHAAGVHRPRPSRQVRHRERGCLAGVRPCLTIARPWQEGQCSTWMSIASLTRLDGSP